MAKVRKFIAYRRLERPYTRKSKYSKKNFIRGSPQNKITRYNMGDSKKTFEYRLFLRVNVDLQIRDKAFESARLMANRLAEQKLGPGNFYLQFRTFPHHFLRENALASGAGADRLSTGMSHAFGKVIGVAAQLWAGDPVFELRINKDKIPIGKMLLLKAATKLPCGCTVTVEAF